MGYDEKFYESLPALCFVFGVIFVIAAAYIGIGHVFGVGYAMIGVTCMISGAYTAVVHRKVRRNGNQAASPSKWVPIF